MTAQELFQSLINDAGLDEATAKAVMDAAKNEKVQARASALRQQSEYDAILAKANKMEESANKAKVYQDWVEKNGAAVEALKIEAAQYRERYGSLNEPTVPTKTEVKSFDRTDVQKIVGDEVTMIVDKSLGPRVVNMTTGMMTVMERHIKHGRKHDIDWNKLQEISNDPKINGDVVKAYEEWDKPAAEIDAKESTEKEIRRRVDEELAKRGTREFFPANDGSSAASGSGISRSSTNKTYDRESVVRAAITGKYGDAVQ